MTRLLSLCGGFLLAVLWFDLMFDTQVLGAPPGDLPEEILASIAAYYARVTTGAAPMSRLIGVVMLTTVIGTLVQVVRGLPSRRWAVVALGACAIPVVLALVRILPNAVRLGARTDPVAVQSALARSICYEHMVCFALMLCYCALQLFAGRLWDRGARNAREERSV